MTKPEILSLYRHIQRIAATLKEGETLYIRDFHNFRGGTPDVYYSLRGAALLHFDGLCSQSKELWLLTYTDTDLQHVHRTNAPLQAAKGALL